MARRRTQKPGETPSGPGKYEEVGPQGGKPPKQREIEITPDDRTYAAYTEAWQKVEACVMNRRGAILS